jgi:hypothetical protein
LAISSLLAPTWDQQGRAKDVSFIQIYGITQGDRGKHARGP